MLSSLPPLWPRDAHSLYHPSLSTHHSTASHNSQHHQGPHAHGHPHQYGPRSQTRTLLSVLRADENAVTNRKANIRRFGAGWLRPPGIPKTLQGMADERAEREEQESAAQREFALAEAQAAAEAEALEREQHGMAMGEGPEILERDLDEDVPDADEDDGTAEEWVDDEQDLDDDGLLPATEAEGEGDYADDGGGRDLDDDVPEAGSYQHTDTDAEDDSSDDSRLPTTAFREVGNTGGGGVLGASVFGSSPAVRVQRGARRSSRWQMREN